MIAVPLVFFAVMNAVSSLHGQKSVAALGGRTFLWFAVTAALAVGVGLAMGSLLQPGARRGRPDGRRRTTCRADVPQPDAGAARRDARPIRSRPLAAKRQSTPAGDLGDLRRRCSASPWSSSASAPPAARKLAGEASETMIQVTRFVLELTPLGTFGLIAALVGAYGFEKLLPLGTFVFALYLACALHIVFVYGGLLLAARPESAEVLPRRRAGHAGGLRGLVELRGDAGGDPLRSPTTSASTRTTPRSRCRWARASRWTAAARSIRR